MNNYIPTKEEKIETIECLFRIYCGKCQYTYGYYFDVNNHHPTVIVPCGHVFCGMCIKDLKECPDCSGNIKSTIPIIFGTSKEHKQNNKQL
jgi:coenzyme F420-reducing hydrogenase beta subunit